MGFWRDACLAAVLAWAAGGAFAQTSAELVPGAALTCLSPAGTAPEYPFAEWQLQRPGRVKVELVFSHADQAPELVVLETEGGPAFVEAVTAHVRTLRVPCLRPDDAWSHVVLEFTFKPDARLATSAAPLDPRDGRLGCLSHISGESSLPYPSPARGWRASSEQYPHGRVLARMRFTAADRPPSVETFQRPSARSLGRLVERWAEGLRTPCLVDGPLVIERVFYFLLEGEAFGFEPLDLRQVLANTRDIESQTLNIDTNTMGCPFELRWSYRQPLLANRPREIGPSVAERRPLLDWLRTAQLKLAPEAEDAAFADNILLRIPCLKIDLKPKEKS